MRFNFVSYMRNLRENYSEKYRTDTNQTDSKKDWKEAKLVLIQIQTDAELLRSRSSGFRS